MIINRRKKIELGCEEIYRYFNPILLRIDYEGSEHLFPIVKKEYIDDVLSGSKVAILGVRRSDEVVGDARDR